MPWLHDRSMYRPRIGDMLGCARAARSSVGASWVSTPGVYRSAPGGGGPGISRSGSGCRHRERERGLLVRAVGRELERVVAGRGLRDGEAQELTPAHGVCAHVLAAGCPVDADPV